jgi:hypothetical protein
MNKGVISVQMEWEKIDRDSSATQIIIEAWLTYLKLLMNSGVRY